MNEETILNEEDSTFDPILKPSEIAEATIGNSATQTPIANPSQTVNDGIVEENVEQAPVVTQSEGSLENAISQITDSINVDTEPVEPIINVNVDSPTIITNPSETVTNNYTIEKESKEDLPSSAILNDVSKTDKEADFKSNESRISQESPISDKDKDSILRTDSKTEKEANSTKESTVIESSIITEKISSLLDIISAEVPDLVNRKEDLYQYQNEPVTPETGLPSLILSNIIKESTNIESQVNTVSDNLSKTVDLLHETIETNKSDEIIKTTQNNQTNTTGENLLTTSNDIVNQNTILKELSKVESSNTKNISDKDFYVLLGDNSENNDGSPIIKTTDPIGDTQLNSSVESDDIKVVIPESKLNSQLVKNIMTSTEATQLSEVNENLSSVTAALKEVNDSQITNNQNISNIVNNSANANSTIISQNRETDKPNPLSEVKKEETTELKQNVNVLSEFYLHAIYDALVSTGIKIKAY